MGSGLLLLPGNSESPMNFTENPYPFRQDSSFLYFFGLNQPDLVGLIDLDDDKDVLFGNDLTIDHIVWMGFHPTVRERAETVGVLDTGPLSEVKTAVQKALSAGRTVHILPPYRGENRIYLSRWLNCPLEALDQFVSVELIKAIVSLREIKAPEEIAEMERAVNTSVDMHVAAMKMARPGVMESEIAARVEEIAKSAGGRLAFPVIATIHGETLHNHDHGNRLKAGDLFLLDCGAETAMGYAGDLSSTVPVSGTLSERQKSIYDLSVKAHRGAVEMLKPGIPFKDAHFQAARIIFEGLKELGLTKGDSEEALKEGAHAMFFPCGLGHQIGLDVHDMEDLGEVYVGYDGVPKSAQFGLKSLRLGKPLKSGMVLTIEPGIYFIPQLIDLWREGKRHLSFINYDELEKWKDFGGIRNEENYVINETGSRPLGKKKPITMEEISEVRNP